MTDLTKLKELAERATPGPWTTDSDQSVIADSDQFNSGWAICECFGSEKKANIEFIKNANPAAVLELIAEVERLRSQVDHLINQHMPREPIPDMPGWTRVIDADRLKAENEALRKQLEQVHPFKFAGQHEGPDIKCSACGGYHYGLPPNMPCPKNAAIAQDAALEGGGE